MTCNEAGAIGAAKAREPFLAKARAMRDQLGLPPSPALNPPLVLTRRDRVGSAINQGEK